MTELKRPLIKYIRDIIKKDYKIRDECYICRSTEELELHHLYSLSQAFSDWCEEKGIFNVDTAEDISAIRFQFVEDSKEKLSNENLVTLCSSHHKKLHNIYGQRYNNSKVPKVRTWLDIQREKYG